ACACVTRRLLRLPVQAAEQVAMVEAVAADIEGPGVTVQYGPAGVQWCSDEMLRRIGTAAERSGRRVHMHLLETRYQRNWADRTYPQGIVRYLDEMDLIAARGATIVINTSSNFIVSSGLAPVGEMLRRGCRLAMGLDGLSFDEDEDTLREMRLLYAVHKAAGFEIRVRREDLLRIACEHGRFAVTGESDGGRIAAGAPADVLVLDWDKLAAELIEPDVPAIELLLAKARQEHVKQLFVAGREIVRDGA